MLGTGLFGECLPCSKPPAGDDLHISKGESHGLGELAPSLTRSSSLHVVKAEGLGVSPTLVVPIGLSWTRTDEITPNLLSGASPPYLRESCIETRLPSRRDVAAEPKSAQVQLDIEHSCSFRCPFYRGSCPFYRGSCPIYRVACSFFLTAKSTFERAPSLWEVQTCSGRLSGLSPRRERLTGILGFDSN